MSKRLYYGTSRRKMQLPLPYVHAEPKRQAVIGREAQLHAIAKFAPSLSRRLRNGWSPADWSGFYTELDEMPSLPPACYDFAVEIACENEQRTDRLFPRCHWCDSVDHKTNDCPKLTEWGANQRRRESQCAGVR